jgi:hypothetical protein
MLPCFRGRACGIEIASPSPDGRADVQDARPDDGDLLLMLAAEGRVRVDRVKLV